MKVRLMRTYWQLAFQFVMSEMLLSGQLVSPCQVWFLKWLISYNNTRVIRFFMSNAILHESIA